tara:strand:+ start:526 stop:1071 length:546 start_codon:yes stop_codon:yes gene_type:complete
MDKLIPILLVVVFVIINNHAAASTIENCADKKHLEYHNNNIVSHFYMLSDEYLIKFIQATCKRVSIDNCGKKSVSYLINQENIFTDEDELSLIMAQWVICGAGTHNQHISWYIRSLDISSKIKKDNTYYQFHAMCEKERELAKNTFDLKYDYAYPKDKTVYPFSGKFPYENISSASKRCYL